MKAIVWTAYGPPDVLKLQEVERPTPKDDQVLIKIHATSVTAGDCEARNMQFPLFVSLPMRLYVGLSKPSRVTILGQELAGEVAAVGSKVKRFKEGDPVYATTGFAMGAYAQYICLPEASDDGGLVHKPANLSYEEAAVVPTGGLEALHFLRGAKIQPGESLLIIGAGGSIGTMGVQLAKHDGAQVTAVDSGPKLELLLDLGADQVLDYTKEDYINSGRTYDIIFDVVGKGPLSPKLKALKPNGRYLLANPRLSTMLRGAWTSRTSDKTVFFSFSGRASEGLLTLKDLIEDGTLKPVIDRVYALEETAEAHRYVETGQKKGSVVIRVD